MAVGTQDIEQRGRPEVLEVEQHDFIQEHFSQAALLRKV